MDFDKIFGEESGTAGTAGTAEPTRKSDVFNTFALATSDANNLEKDLFVERNVYKLIRKVYDKTKANLLFVGPTGSGKTRFATRLSAENGREFQRICLDDTVPLGEWLATTALKEVNGASVAYDKLGILAEAIQKPQDLILDEQSRMSANKVSPLNQLLDSGKIMIRGYGQVNKHPDCRIIGTMNPHNGVYSGTHKLDPSTVNRYYVFDIPQFNKEELDKVIPDGPIKEQLIGFYIKTQEAIVQQQLDFEFSIRNIQAICEIMSLGGSLREALDIGLLNAVQLTSDVEQRSLVLNLASAEFGTAILAENADSAVPETASV